jgi:hypothetical protein
MQLKLPIQQGHIYNGNGKVSVFLPHCWSQASMHPAVPAIGQLDTAFLGCVLYSGKC